MDALYLSEEKPYLSLVPPFVYNPDFCKKTMYQMIQARSAGYENICALNYYGAIKSNSEFMSEVDSAADSYAALGLKKDDNISFFGLNTPELVESIYAVNKIGAISEWFNPNVITPNMLRKHINNNKVKALFIVDVIRDIVETAIEGTDIQFVVVNSLTDTLPETLSAEGFIKSKPPIASARRNNNDSRFISWKDFIGLKKENASAKISTDYMKVSMIVHTGGTTGPIKRIAMNDYAINSAPYQMSLMPHCYRPGDSILQITPPMVAWSLECIHASRFFNMTLNLIVSYDRNEFAKIMLRTKSNHYLTVPSFVKRIAEDPILEGKDLSFVKSVYHGGESISAEDDKKVDRVLSDCGSSAKSVMGFGQNEEFGAFFINLYIPGNEKVYDSCGIPLAGNDYIIYDLENKKELPYGKDEQGKYQIGELLVSGPSAMIGYVGADEVLNKTTILFINGKRYIDTGDLAYADENGRMFYCTRIQRIVRTQQGKIHVNVIENILNAMTEIEECCVVKMPDAQNVAKASCHIVLNREYRELSEDELRPLIDKIVRTVESKTREMYTYYTPGSYVFRRRKLPLTAFGKVAYRELEAENEDIFARTEGHVPKIRVF